MSPRFVVVCLSVAASILVHPALAQEWSGTARISGVVTDPKGNPVEGARVRYHLPGEPEAGPPAFVTDEDGEYRYTGLKSASWVVEIEADGFLPFTIPQPTFVYAAGRNDPLRIQLEPVPEEILRAKERAEINKRLVRGDELRAQGQYEAAREEYTKALGEIEEQEQPIVLAALADAYMHEGQLDQARAVLTRSLAIAPDHGPSVSGMMVIAIDGGSLEEAGELLQRLPPSQEIDPTILMKIAEGYYVRDEMSEAKTLLDRVLSAHPDTVAGYYFRGLVEFNLNQIAAARADIARFLELAPDHPKAAEANEVLEYLQTLEAE